MGRHSKHNTPAMVNALRSVADSRCDDAAEHMEYLAAENKRFNSNISNMRRDLAEARSQFESAHEVLDEMEVTRNQGRRSLSLSERVELLRAKLRAERVVT